MNYLDSIQTAVEGLHLALYNQFDKIRPENWWKQRSKEVKRLIESDDKIVKESGFRMYDYTWRSLLSWGASYLDDPLIPEHAERYFRAWCVFDPDSPEAFYWMAGAFGARGNDKKALRALETAVDNGFSSARRIEDAGSFRHLHENEEYKDLVARVKALESTD
jgi:hypothetical protein